MSHVQSAAGQASKSVRRVRTQLLYSKMGNVFLNAARASTVEATPATVKLTHT